jgi:putative N6-adenine-specific DNA methylase
LIEAALQARNIAPGLKKVFASEHWPQIPHQIWQQSRQSAIDSIDKESELKIFGYDIDETMIIASKANARRAGVEDDIGFAQKDIRDLWIDQQYGIVISNPPYGIKLLELQDLNQIYISFHKTFRKKNGWSIYILTADKKFPDFFKRAKPDRVRKLFNGNIEVNYYQYYGDRPPPA